MRGAALARRFVMLGQRACHGEAHEIYVGVGSNIEPERHLRIALAALRECFGTLRCSAVYRSPAFGFEGDDFLNMVVGFVAATGPLAIDQSLSSIEYAGGRTRQARRYVSRTLDLDLLLYGACVNAEWRLPRDDVLRFPFVLGPLAELAPTLVHPLLGSELGSLWEAMASGPLRLERTSLLAELLQQR